MSDNNIKRTKFIEISYSDEYAVNCGIFRVKRNINKSPHDRMFFHQLIDLINQECLFHCMHNVVQKYDHDYYSTVICVPYIKFDSEHKIKEFIEQYGFECEYLGSRCFNQDQVNNNYMIEYNEKESIEKQFNVVKCEKNIILNCFNISYNDREKQKVSYEELLHELVKQSKISNGDMNKCIRYSELEGDYLQIYFGIDSSVDKETIIKICEENGYKCNYSGSIDIFNYQYSSNYKVVPNINDYKPVIKQEYR